ncbi:MAG: cytochrome P450 [Gammaproteobacteria bacterium]
MTDVRPILDMDQTSPEFASDPHGQLRRARERCPVGWTRSNGGHWIVTGYKEMAAVAEDDATFSSRRLNVSDGSAITIPGPQSVVNIPIEYDPPESTAFRRLMNPITSPQAVDRMKPLFRKWVTWFIDEMIEQGHGDLVLDFASPVPAAVTVEWLGFPTRDWRRFAEPYHNVVSYKPDTPEFRKAERDMHWIYEQIHSHVQARRTTPRDDIVSYFVRQTVDGRPLTDDELVSIISLLIAGGVDTTTSLTGQALLYLARHPDVRRRLIDEPDRIADATEEFLRCFAPVTALARRATRDVTLGGVQVMKGERLWVSWAAANRDPANFPDPDTLDIDRFPNRHASFGLGSHRCAGSTVARFMFREMLSQILARMPEYRVDESKVEHYPSQGTNLGVLRLPATFTPGPRIGERVF